MFNRRIGFVAVVLLLVVPGGQSQNCSLLIRGQVVDEVSQLCLPLVNVFVQETERGAVTDEQGGFLLDSLCAGEYHIYFSHIGCETKKLHIKIGGDTILNVDLPHTINALGTIVVEGQSDGFNSQSVLSINRKTIDDNTNESISGLLENEAGVHLIRNGSGISKPVVHGLYGNRLTILNNGIAQNGQQWGNDHSPEIDPFIADRISVLKGVNTIEYGGGNLGSVILIQPKPVLNEPHLHGQFNYAFESNGKGHILNTRLEKSSDLLAWRINGTLKKYGDRKTPDYFLNNTGIEEANFSLQLDKSWQSKFFLTFYGSMFNTRLGILRGAHIGNLTDLEEALTRMTPFFTEPKLSFDIDAPRQEVSHSLTKITAKYIFNDQEVLEFVAAGQVNNRKEFDVRRSGRTDIPALSLLQVTLNSDLKYSRLFNNNWKLKVGNQNTLTDNTNNPETGILPLVPDYISWKTGLFGVLSKIKNKAKFNLGIRYDFEMQNVVAISRELPRKIIRHDNRFHQISGLFALKHDVARSQSFAFNTGYAMRNPAVNELYSNGLHQGVSGIEEGDQNLRMERGIKNSLEYKWFPNTHFSFSVLIYHQYFKDYIFLKPQDELRLTIRGAFPVFKYEQTDASIYGLDLSSQLTIGNGIFAVIKYSYLKGRDLESGIPLIYMPPNSFYGSITYQLKRILRLGHSLKIEESEIQIDNRFVFQQNNILEEQDFSPPPPPYDLLGFKVSTNLVLRNHKIRCYIKADNLLNNAYRDYLNRQRYFADDVGLSITGGISLGF